MRLRCWRRRKTADGLQVVSGTGEGEGAPRRSVVGAEISLQRRGLCRVNRRGERRPRCYGLPVFLVLLSQKLS
ncbi:hypothetical protein K402DRAFT_262895 [Aulographum hederae CBS 113979]|uniref:Uncharacterized protein n=1 Tax=Aulographum hederae CBS 113979 TaxID=1176131 RepID=A0A6G1H948_9PEZI|nr:hypothetical protein K402DRAFT_262895 [Aulographum hederae CBS 113979]